MHTQAETISDHEVSVFGSRVEGTAKACSDLDLAVISDAPLPLRISAGQTDDFAGSDLPRRSEPAAQNIA
jgi:predicted nucleotidyltransferase